MNPIILSHEDVLTALPDRLPDSHKGNYGKILLLCGSKRYTGAPALSALGALRSGAGLVYLAVPESIYMIEAIKLYEPIVFPVPERDGMFCEESFLAVKEMLHGADSVLIGPGIGRSEEACSFVLQILNTYQGTVILDADGISMMAEHKDVLRGRSAVTILTPHEGEFCRMYSLDSGRMMAAQELALELGAIVVLKGHETVITDGTITYLNPTGNPGMAVGGSGDVLAGMITGLIGQGLDPLKAVACAVWLHGAAGDLCAQELGQYGMLPTDMLQALPRLMK